MCDVTDDLNDGCSLDGRIEKMTGYGKQCDVQYTNGTENLFIVFLSVQL